MGAALASAFATNALVRCNSAAWAAAMAGPAASRAFTCLAACVNAAATSVLRLNSSPMALLRMLSACDASYLKNSCG
jgi:hypothetical protein